jgi:hypothetical protein
MQLNDDKANELIHLAKEATKTEVFTWEHNRQQEELLIAVQDRDMHFLLTLKRNPFEIKAQLRTRERHVPLVRLDNAAQHVNPDGTVLRGPHLHWYKEGDGLAWASPADWCDLTQPMQTVMRFLDIIQTRFPKGFQEALL